jgi:hypothetical protein
MILWICCGGALEELLESSLSASFCLHIDCAAAIAKQSILWTTLDPDTEITPLAFI